MKIALVHDYLKESGGAERVLLELALMYPKAPIYTAYVDRRSLIAKELRDHKVIESSWGWLLKIGKLYSYLRFCLPLIWKSIDLTDYDLVITSCSGYIARGFRVRKNAKVVAYCHTPPRWLYGYDTPTGAQNLWWGKAYMWIFGPFVRYFDYVSAQRVDLWVANSQEVAARIKKFYRKEAIVVYPPCEVSEIRNDQPSYAKASDGKHYWLIVSRIVGGKGLELAAKMARQVKQKLVIVGAGEKNYGERIKHYGGEYVNMLGYVADSEMGDIYASAKGFLAFAVDEDFGITVVEAMAQGIPVLAYNGGGYRETVKDGVNGKLVVGSRDKAIENAIISEMKKWEKYQWDREKIRNSVKKFGKERFVLEMRRLIHARTTRS